MLTNVASLIKDIDMEPFLRKVFIGGITFVICFFLTTGGKAGRLIADEPDGSDRENHSFVNLTDPERPGTGGADTLSEPLTPEPPEVELRSGSIGARIISCSPLEETDGPIVLDPTEDPSVETAQLRDVWGILDFRGYPIGQAVASNGVEYNPLFSLNLNFNIMLWRRHRVYLFSDSSFWGQKAAPGITNANQGSFDFSKREYDFNLGTAWNYFGRWEARAFAYSFNNLNRGYSQTSPSGFNDGFGLENRYYLGKIYDQLGTSQFDLARATFLSVGYYPTKTMEDLSGNQFKPGLFTRAYLTQNIWGDRYYLFADLQFIASHFVQPTLFNWDAGLAARPFRSVPRLEFRVGSQDLLNLQTHDIENTVYTAIRFVY